jgi:hypothetical protein
MNQNLSRFVRAAAAGIVGLLLLTTSGWAQTALTSTTLSSAIVNANDQTMTLASTTGFSATTTAAQYYAVIDREVVAIRTVNTTTGVVGITRGVSPGMKATGHVSGATVYFIPAGSLALSNFDRAGACSAANTTADFAQTASSVPVINPQTGSLFQCVSGQWYRGDITNTFSYTLNGLNQPANNTATAGGAGITATGGAGSAAITTTTTNGGAGGAPSITGGVGGVGGTTSGTGGAGGAVTATGGIGGGTVTGGAGGAVSLTAGAGAAGSTAAGAGGAAAILAGAGGANAASAGTGAAGGAASLTAGAGGLDSTGAATGGVGGAVNVIAGAGGGTITGGAGGALALGAGAGANGSTAGGTGGALALYSGAAGTGGTGTSGAITVKSGGAGGTNVFATTVAGATTVSAAGTNQTLTLAPTGTGSVTLTNANVQQAVTASSSATVTLTAAQCGGIFAMDRSAGIAYYLPVPVVGCTFDFVTTVAWASGASEIATAPTTSGTIFMQGIVMVVGTTTMGFAAVPTTAVAVKEVGTTTGGAIGGHLKFTALSATLWDVQGTAMGSGTVATPFVAAN